MVQCKREPWIIIMDSKTIMLYVKDTDYWQSKRKISENCFFFFHNLLFFIICQCQFLHPLCIHANVFSRKHYREYLVSLINSHSVDPAPIYSSSELLLACKRYKVEEMRRDGEDSFIYYSRLLEVSLRGNGALWCCAKIEFINCLFGQSIWTTNW